MNKSEEFGLVLSPAEKDILRRLAEDEGGLSMASMIRRLVRAEARRHGLWPPSPRRDKNGRRREVPDAD
jgi:hypothetical protein